MAFEPIKRLSPTPLNADQQEVIRRTAELACGRLPEVEVFENANFDGDHLRTSFSCSYVGDDWNDRISSFIIYSGHYQFFADRDFQTPTGGLIGPGQYNTADVGICNDCISSWTAYCDS